MTIEDGEGTVLQRPAQDRQLALGIATELHTGRAGYSPDRGAADVLADAELIFEWLTGSGGHPDGYTPGWAVSLHTMIRKVLRQQEEMMTQANALTQEVADALTALQTKVDALKAEDSIVVTEIQALAAKAQSQGSVSDADVQAAVDAIHAKVADIQTEIDTVTAAATAAQPPAPNPAPAPTTGP